MNMRIAQTGVLIRVLQAVHDHNTSGTTRYDIIPAMSTSEQRSHCRTYDDAKYKLVGTDTTELAYRRRIHLAWAAAVSYPSGYGAPRRFQPVNT